jgi:lactoylglutathione lyase
VIGRDAVELTFRNRVAFGMRIIEAIDRMAPVLETATPAKRAVAVIGPCAAVSFTLVEERMAKTSIAVRIAGVAHIGIRVHDLDRSVAFYRLLGFTKTAGPLGPEPVAILEHPSGLEVNLVLNAPNASEPNILMDVPDKHPGITHLALLCPDVVAAKQQLEAAGIPLSGGPVRFDNGALAIFVRDPDRIVIELHQRK